MNLFNKSERINTLVNTNSPMVKTIFAQKSSRIVRAILSKPSNTWTTRELASAAKVSLGLVSEVTNRLIDMGYLVRDRSMRLRLRKEEELLKRWASFYDLSQWQHKTYYRAGSLYEIATELATVSKRNDLKYAFTGPFAADLLTRYIRPAEIHIYVTDQDAVTQIVNAMNLEIAEIGGNVIFLIADDDSVFYVAREIADNRVGKAMIVSDVQLILDLYNYTDRAREAAERLLKKEFTRESEHLALVRLVEAHFEKQGLIPAEPQGVISAHRPDIVLVDPKTNEYAIIECKNSTAKLDSVDELKRTLSIYGSRTRGILIAPDITDAARKELSQAGLEFQPIERIKHGLHTRTG